MGQNRPRVYVSSTYADLVEQRGKLIPALRGAGFDASATAPARWQRTLLRTCALATLCGGLVSTAWAEPDPVALQSLERAAARVHGLETLRTQALQAHRQAEWLSDAGQAGATAWQDTVQAGAAAQQAIDRAAACLTTLRAEIRSDTASVDQLTRSIATSHQKARALSVAAAPQIAGQTRAADQAFAERSQAEHALTDAGARLQSAVRHCDAAVTSADAALRGAIGHSQRFAGQAASLAADLQRLRRHADAALAATRAAADRGWQSYRPAPLVLPAGEALARLRQAAGRGPASLPASGTDLRPMRDLAAAAVDLQRSSTELARLEDAAAYIDLVAAPATPACGAPDCAAFAAERAELAGRITATRQSLAAARSRLTTTALDGLLKPAQAAAMLNTRWQQQVGNTVPAALAEVSRAGAAATKALFKLEWAADRAYADARTDWLAAYRLAHGAPPDDLADLPPTGAGWAGAAPPPPAPAPKAGAARPPELREHAYTVFSNWDTELRGFGSYTYVLLRSQDDLKTPAVMARFRTLLAVLHRQREAGTVVAAERPQFNLFCIPGSPSAQGSTNEFGFSYASDLGNQLKLRARNAVFTVKAARERLTSSPGPFLLTLPGRIADAQGDSPLLFADLGSYPDEAITDLVESYMNGLLDQFPRDKALWKPPMPQRVALMMIRLASLSGEVQTRVMPAAEASTATR